MENGKGTWLAKELGKIILSAIVAACIVIAAVFGIELPGGQAAGGIGTQGLQVQKFGNPVRFMQAVTHDGALTQTGAATFASTVTVTGATALNGGLSMDTSAFTVADTSGNTAIAGTLSVGGGYGSTGCSVSAAGVLQCDGAATFASTLAVTGASTLDGGLSVDTSAFTVADTSGNTTIAGTLSVGGGFGSTGCSVSAAGVLQCDGAATLGSTLTVTGTQTLVGATTHSGAVTINNNATITGTISGGAEGNAVINALHDVTAAEINAGHTLVTVPNGLAFRLVDVAATAYGGACGAVTTVDLKVGSTTLVTYAQANLTQSTRLHMSATGVTLVADGASYTAGTAGDDVTVIKNGSDVTTCTGVRFILSYVLQ